MRNTDDLRRMLRLYAAETATITPKDRPTADRLEICRRTVASYRDPPTTLRRDSANQSSAGVGQHCTMPPDAAVWKYTPLSLIRLKQRQRCRLGVNFYTRVRQPGSSAAWRAKRTSARPCPSRGRAGVEPAKFAPRLTGQSHTLQPHLLYKLNPNMV